MNAFVTSVIEHDINLARESFFGEIRVIREELAADFARLDAWVESVEATIAAEASDRSDDTTVLAVLGVRIRRNVRRQVAMDNAAQRIANAMKTYVEDIQFITSGK